MKKSPIPQYHKPPCPPPLVTRHPLGSCLAHGQWLQKCLFFNLSHMFSVLMSCCLHTSYLNLLHENLIFLRWNLINATEEKSYMPGGANTALICKLTSRTKRTRTSKCNWKRWCYKCYNSPSLIQGKKILQAVAEKVFMIGLLEKWQLQLYVYCRVCMEA